MKEAIEDWSDTRILGELRHDGLAAAEGHEEEVCEAIRETARDGLLIWKTGAAPCGASVRTTSRQYARTLAKYVIPVRDPSFGRLTEDGTDLDAEEA